MTRLDIVKMNKDYVDPAEFERANNAFKSSASASVLKKNMVSLDAIQTYNLDKLKSLLRQADLPINHEARTQLWKILCSNTINHTVNDDYTFKGYAEKFASVTTEAFAIKDMTEEMRLHQMLGDAGKHACHRVVYAISETHPHIQQFTPLLYAITSILLHYLDEESSFNCLFSLLKRRDVNFFLAPSQISLQASIYVLKDLTFRYAKSAAVYIENCLPDGDLANFCNDWVFWIFKHLPFFYLIRVVDCFLVEGFKVLYRVALTLISLYHKQSLHSPVFFDTSKPDAAMKRFCEDIPQHCTCDKMLKMAFGIRGFSKKEIDELFTKNEHMLRASGNMLYSTPSHTSAEQSRVANRNSSEKSSILRNMKSKKSFKLDSEIHTHISLDGVTSQILDKLQQYKVWSWLPPAESVREPVLVFTTNEHGYSLKTFYEKVENWGPVLMIIRTTDGEILGAYCSVDWVQRHSCIDSGAQINYFGTGQSFVFELKPRTIRYQWVGKESAVSMPASSSMFQAADKTMLMIGGGSGTAIQIDKDLDYGHTEKCDTFDNEPLVNGSQFRIQCMEVFAFTS